MGSVAKSYMRKGFLIYEEMRKYLTIYEEAVSHIYLCNRSLLNFLIYEENFLFVCISVGGGHEYSLRLRDNDFFVVASFPIVIKCNACCQVR
jgi:hypothetical protein